MYHKIGDGKAKPSTPSNNQLNDYLRSLNKINLWNLMGYSPNSWGDWLTKLPSRFPWYSKTDHMSEVPGDWKKSNIAPIFKKGRNKDPENYWPVSFISVPGKIMEQIHLEAVLRHMEGRGVIWDSQYAFIKGKSCLTNTEAFHDGRTTSVEKGRAFIWNSVRPLTQFSTLSFSLSHRSMDFYAWAIQWMRNHLDVPIQRVEVNSSLSRERWVVSGVS